MGTYPSFSMIHAALASVMKVDERLCSAVTEGAPEMGSSGAGWFGRISMERFLAKAEPLLLVVEGQAEDGWVRVWRTGPLTDPKPIAFEIAYTSATLTTLNIPLNDCQGARWKMPEYSSCVMPGTRTGRLFAESEALGPDGRLRWGARLKSWKTNEGEEA